MFQQQTNFFSQQQQQENMSFWKQNNFHSSKTNFFGGDADEPPYCLQSTHKPIDNTTSVCITKQKTWFSVSLRQSVFDYFFYWGSVRVVRSDCVSSMLIQRQRTRAPRDSKSHKSCVFRTTVSTARLSGRLDADVTSLQRKVTRIVITDFLCWFPVCVMAFISVAGK